MSAEASSVSFANEVDIFTEGMDKSDSGDIFFNCLKNLEAKVMGQGNKNWKICILKVKCKSFT